MPPFPPATARTWNEVFFEWPVVVRSRNQMSHESFFVWSQVVEDRNAVTMLVQLPVVMVQPGVQSWLKTDEMHGVDRP